MVLSILIGLAAPAFADPVVTKTDDGVIDWTARTLSAVGVGTPAVLSPTGALTPREPYDVARTDAEKRIARLLARVPVDRTRRLRDLDPLDERRQAVAKTFTAEASRHFADGTVHLPARVPLAWIAAEWPAESAESPAAPPPVGPPAPGPTGLVVELAEPIEPTVRLSLRLPSKTTLTAGTARDPIGATGAYYVYDPADLDLKTLVGASPLTVKGRAGDGRGTIELSDASLLGRRVPGAVVVVLPTEGGK